ncbi:hypothetical protein AA15669_0481 [Saccharibacter floricola DSM 15669]|uniref:Uncharacterized protein n=1 Tax=Saccharibacter floricola DSM 15669 TaxID=1123227 RepID=A0ABQ0NXA8_9PROT|nr:hypothetical protein AA15669_0481 [Saccharibacter floricola DSM 15669]
MRVVFPPCCNDAGHGGEEARRWGEAQSRTILLEALNPAYFGEKAEREVEVPSNTNKEDGDDRAIKSWIGHKGMDKHRV